MYDIPVMKDIAAVDSNMEEGRLARDLAKEVVIAVFASMIASFVLDRLKVIDVASFGYLAWAILVAAIAIAVAGLSILTSYKRVVELSEEKERYKMELEDRYVPLWARIETISKELSDRGTTEAYIETLRLRFERVKVVFNCTQPVDMFVKFSSHLYGFGLESEGQSRESRYHWGITLYENLGSRHWEKEFTTTSGGYYYFISRLPEKAENTNVTIELYEIQKSRRRAGSEPVSKKVAEAPKPQPARSYPIFQGPIEVHKQREQRYAELAEGDILEGTIEEVDGFSFDFCIFEEKEYVKFSSDRSRGKPALALYDRSAYYVKWTVPHSGTWFIVFDLYGKQYDRTIGGTLRRTSGS